MTFFQPEELKGRKLLPTLAECGRCGLFKHCASPKLKAQGKGKLPILFVNEAPSERDDEAGQHLTGKAGEILRRVLKQNGVNLDDCMTTSAIICRPSGGKPSDLHVHSCRPNLTKLLKKFRPKVIILLGYAGVKSLMPTQREASVGKAEKWTGWRIPLQGFDAWVCPTHHPVQLLRSKSPVLEREFDEQVEAALSMLKEPTPQGFDLESLKSQVDRVYEEERAIKLLKKLNKLRGVIAFDYESTSIKPDHEQTRIVACSFSFMGDWTFSFRTTPRTLPWLSEVLLNPKLKKVAANLKNEERWTKAKLGHSVVGWYWDTMLAAHFLDNRGGISSLKFQSFINFGVADYEQAVSHYFRSEGSNSLNRIDECPVDELLLYNGLDSYLTYELMLEQRYAAGFSLPKRIITSRGTA